MEHISIGPTYVQFMPASDLQWMVMTNFVPGSIPTDRTVNIYVVCDYYLVIISEDEMLALLTHSTGNLLTHVDLQKTFSMFYGAWYFSRSDGFAGVDD